MPVLCRETLGKGSKSFALRGEACDLQTPVSWDNRKGEPPIVDRNARPHHTCLPRLGSREKPNHPIALLGRSGSHSNARLFQCAAARQQRSPVRLGREERRPEWLEASFRGSRIVDAPLCGITKFHCWTARIADVPLERKKDLPALQASLRIDLDPRETLEEN